MCLQFRCLETDFITPLFYCYLAPTTLKTSHMVAIPPVHWRADCCLATSYKHSSYCCVTLSEVFIAPLPSYTCYNIHILHILQIMYNKRVTKCWPRYRMSWISSLMETALKYLFKRPIYDYLYPNAKSDNLNSWRISHLINHTWLRYRILWYDAV
jgi:hypothetical protein